MKRSLLLVSLVIAFVLADPLFGDDGKEVDIDFRGAFYSGIVPIATEHTGMASALNALKFEATKNEAAERLLMDSRKKVFAQQSKDNVLVKKDDFIKWFKAIEADQFTVKDIDIQSASDLRDVHQDVFKSLLADTPIILALDTFVVVCRTVDDCFWKWSHRRFVVVARIEPLREDKKSLSLLLLNPLGTNSDLVDALVVYRPGNPKTSYVVNNVNFGKPMPTIHGNQIDNQEKDSWAQRSVTVPVWMIGQF